MMLMHYIILNLAHLLIHNIYFSAILHLAITLSLFYICNKQILHHHTVYLSRNQAIKTKQNRKKYAFIIMYYLYIIFILIFFDLYFEELKNYLTVLFMQIICIFMLCVLKSQETHSIISKFLK